MKNKKTKHKNKILNKVPNLLCSKHLIGRFPRHKVIHQRELKVLRANTTYLTKNS